MLQEFFKLVLTDEAREFIEELPDDVSYKVLYNIRRVAGGERNPELFKKLSRTEIWEFRTLYKKIAYRLFAFWDKDEETLVIATHGIINNHPTFCPGNKILQFPFGGHIPEREL